MSHLRLPAACAAFALLGFGGCGAPTPESRPATVPQATPPAQGRQDLPAEALKVEWLAVAVPPRMAPGQELELDVTLRNASSVAWPGGAGTTGLAYTVRLSHRWLQGDKVVRDYGQTRVELPTVVSPGQTITVRALVTAPGTPGRYQVQVDLVHENVAWFEHRGAGRKLVDVEVR